MPLLTGANLINEKHGKMSETSDGEGFHLPKFQTSLYIAFVGYVAVPERMKASEISNSKKSVFDWVEVLDHNTSPIITCDFG